MNIIDHFAAYCEKHNREWETACSYGEPGYTDPAEGKLILFANWNDIPRSLFDALEEDGYELEWSDEWYVDHDQAGGKAWRTSPSSYHWVCQIQWSDEGCGYLTPDDSADDWIQWAVNDPGRVLPDHIDLAANGFVKENEDEYQSGLHPGMNDQPSKVFERVKDRGDVVFQVDRLSQFYSEWSCWIRKEDSGENLHL